jgi:multicomponent K+:H+ antiporter subunit G
MLGEWMVAAALLVGAFFTLVGSIGLLRFPDFFSRLHAPTKASTLGVGALLIASLIHSADLLSLHELLIALFLFMTAPVSAYVLGKAAMHLGAPGSGGREPPDIRRDPSDTRRDRQP